VLLNVFIFWLIDLNDPTANYFNSIIEPSLSAWGLAAGELDSPLTRLLFGWSARQFRSFMFADIPGVVGRQASSYLANLSTEISWLAVALSVVGAAALLVRRWRVGLLLLAALLVQWFYFFNYEIWDLYVFYIPSYVLLTLFAVAGMGALADLGAAVVRRIIPSVNDRWLDLAVVGALALLVFVFALWPLFRPQKDAVLAGRNPFDFDEYPVYDENLQKIAIATVLELPEGAIVFTGWDMVWPYYYAAHIIEARRDLTFIETYPADDLDGVADSVVDYIAVHVNNHPIFFGEREPALLEAGYTFAPARYGPTRLSRVIAK
jgi:hypothetical protein